MKGLSFSEPMVKAWLAGKKTVTRRLMNPQPPDHFAPLCCSNGTWVLEENIPPHILKTYPLKPRYRPGETVYIKETWCQPVMGGWKSKTESCRRYNVVEYAADMGIERFPISGNFTPRRDVFHWKSPRFMPEWASRSHALIVSVIPEKIQGINEVDAYLEGFRDQLRGEIFWPVGAQFREIWETLHPGSWERNDWCWRIELKKQ